MEFRYQKVIEIIDKHEPGALCTIVESQGSTPRGAGSKMLVYEDASIHGTVGGGEVENRIIKEALAAIKSGRTKLLEYSMSDPESGDPGVCGGQLKVYVEPIMPKPDLIVIGVGHVGREVARLGDWLGFNVIANDDRADFCTPEMVPEASHFIVGSIQSLTEEITLRPWSYVVLTTRGVDVDVDGLPFLLDAEPAYIGLIGSKKRWLTTRKTLEEKGISADTLDRVHSPVGLELHAETPAEIAVSIMAEIIMQKNGGDGKPMKIDAE